MIEGFPLEHRKGKYLASQKKYSTDPLLMSVVLIFCHFASTLFCRTFVPFHTQGEHLGKKNLCPQ